MNRAFKQLSPRNITGQITGLIVVSLIVTYGVTTAVLVHLINPPRGPAGPIETVERITTVAKMAKSAGSFGEAAVILDTAQRAGIKVNEIAFPCTEESSGTRRDEGLARALTARLGAGFRVSEGNADEPQPGSRSIIVDYGAPKALAFGVDAKTHPPRLPEPILRLTLIFLSVVVIMIYAGRWITSPLSAFASAARSFGLAPDEERVLREAGPAEIVQVARALNEMRRRVRDLLDERTRMLLALSHDLRTPLTRLQLRAERVPDPNLRDGMLYEIAGIEEMLRETLTFLRGEPGQDAVERIDLPSVLQTICSDFNDVGYAVSYVGPEHFAYPCRAGALTRAVTNIVDNGVKYGSVVTVELEVLQGQSAQISVSDNGPGIPPELRPKVLEPFFKVEAARSSSGRTGFGLGLSIAHNIVREHGGAIELIGRASGGLTVRLSLPWRT